MAYLEFRGTLPFVQENQRPCDRRIFEVVQQPKLAPAVPRESCPGAAALFFTFGSSL